MLVANIYSGRARQYYLLVAFLLTTLGCDSQKVTEYPEQLADSKILKPVIIIAHRGGMAYAPENTLEAFDNGRRVESDMLEMDVQVANGQFFALHDFSLQRTTSCSAQSSTVNAQIREQCDAGFRWTAGTNIFFEGTGLPYFRGKGVRIPLLVDVLSEFSNSNMRFMIELKHIDVGDGGPSIEQALTALVTLIVDRSMENSVWINSGNPHVLSRIEAAAPSISTVLSWGDHIAGTCEESVVGAINFGIDGVALQASQSNRADFRPCVLLAQAVGLTVTFWVVNRPEDVERLLQLKPDALLTDFPACLAALLRGKRVEDPYPDVVQHSDFLPKCG